MVTSPATNHHHCLVVSEFINLQLQSGAHLVLPQPDIAS